LQPQNKNKWKQKLRFLKKSIKFGTKTIPQGHVHAHVEVQMHYSNRDFHRAERFDFGPMGGHPPQSHQLQQWWVVTFVAHEKKEVEVTFHVIHKRWQNPTKAKVLLPCRSPKKGGVDVDWNW